jgi:excisionase family DNA binding protein
LAAERQKAANRNASAKSEEPEATEQSRERKVDFLTARQLGELLQISESTVHRLRREGRIPAVMITDKLIRFNIKDVKQALKSTQTVRPPSDQSNEEPSPQLSFNDLYEDFE